MTFATVLTGHTALLQGVSYILCQCVGAIVGAAITKGLRPAGAGDVGCFGPSGISRTQLWGWETINTFLLVSTIYAVAISQKVFFCVTLCFSPLSPVFLNYFCRFYHMHKICLPDIFQGVSSIDYLLVALHGPLVQLSHSLMYLCIARC